MHSIGIFNNNNRNSIGLKRIFDYCPSSANHFYLISCFHIAEEQGEK